jgi:hypothetical protein
MSRWLFNLLFVLEVITIGILGVFLLYAVHCAFDRVCARHARRLQATGAFFTCARIQKRTDDPSLTH